MRWSDSTVRGRTVISADGLVVGSIAELFISAADWKIESIRIELGGDVADREAHRPTAAEAAPQPTA